jgi:hypothetical protein
MSKPKSFKENLVTWRTMANNLEPRLDELAYLRDQHAALVALLDHAEGLQAEQAFYAAKLQQVNRERAAAARMGRRLRNRLADGLRGSLGAESEQLVEFGVPPQRRRARRQGPKTARARRATKADAEGAAQPGDRPLLN